MDTMVTDAFSGRAARVKRTRYALEMERMRALVAETNTVFDTPSTEHWKVSSGTGPRYLTVTDSAPAPPEKIAQSPATRSARENMK
jgi:hypothetical protein